MLLPPRRGGLPRGAGKEQCPASTRFPSALQPGRLQPERRGNLLTGRGWTAGAHRRHTCAMKFVWRSPAKRTELPTKPPKPSTRWAENPAAIPSTPTRAEDAASVVYPRYNLGCAAAPVRSVLSKDSDGD